MSVLKNISVLVSIGVHPISGAARYSRNDALALALAQQLVKNESAQIEVIHAGNPTDASINDEILSEYLALGAPSVKVIASDGENVVKNVAAHLKNSDLILTGSRAEDEDATGLLPYLLAEKLGLPLIANVLDITLTEEGVEALQFLPKGKRRRVKVTLPAVIAVHPLAPVALHYAHARKISGKIEFSAEKNEFLNKQSTTYTKTLPTHSAIKSKANKLKAIGENYGIYKTGYTRMTDALVTESKGGIVVIGQTSVEKAQVVLRYLREHHLINF